MSRLPIMPNIDSVAAEELTRKGGKGNRRERETARGLMIARLGKLGCRECACDISDARFSHPEKRTREKEQVSATPQVH